MATDTAQPLLRVTGLRVVYRPGRFFSGERQQVCALRGIDLSVNCGASVAIVGESGSGKSTLARCLAGWERASAGEIWFDGRNTRKPEGDDPGQACWQIQLILQDTSAALNPRFTAQQIVAEPLRIQHKGNSAEQMATVAELMGTVQLPRTTLGRRPQEFSGGQRQRLAIARALALRPRLLILDEALAGLDGSVQLQIIGSLKDLQRQYDLTYLFISHDLAMMSEVADEIAVLHEGTIVERGKMDEVINRPTHPRTLALLRAMPGKHLGRLT